MTPAKELLAEIRRFLKDEVQAELSAEEQSAKAYQNRICVNVLGILEREAELQPCLVALDDEALARAAFDPTDRWGKTVSCNLALALRDAKIAPTPELMSYLRRRSLLMLAINNPRYSGFAQARSAWGTDAEWLRAQLDARTHDPEK